MDIACLLDLVLSVAAMYGKRSLVLDGFFTMYERLLRLGGLGYSLYKQQSTSTMASIAHSSHDCLCGLAIELAPKRSAFACGGACAGLCQFSARNMNMM